MHLNKPRLFAVVGLLATLSSAPAFTVKRNVNAANQPVEQVVIFDQNAGHEHIHLVPKGKNCAMGYAENGAIEIKFTGSTEALPEIRWTPGEGRPAQFNAHDYTYVILRCQWSGSQTRTFPNGRTVEQKPDNPWFTTMLLDAEGVRTSALNLASISETEAVPWEMTTMKIPMSLFLQTAFNDPTQLEAIAFKVGGTHSYNERDYTFTIEKIALAN